MSCILPFAPEAVHRRAEHTRRAGDRLAEVLELIPGAVHSAWLLNIARMASGDYPAGVPPAFRLPPEALTSPIPYPHFRDRARDLGVASVDLAGGAVMDDFDGDGLLDLVTSTWDPCGSLKAYRNDGRGGFEEVTVRWGLQDQLGGLNLIHADFDGDRALDLLVLRGGWLGTRGAIRNSLLRNDLARSGRFLDTTRDAGLALPAHATQTAAAADYDGDGDLDLYIGNESASGRATPSQLFRNDGYGVFVDVATEAGVTNDRFAKGVAWGDFDDDGAPDLYVSNLGPNRLYRSNRDGTFTDVAVALGVDEPVGRSFATWFFDVDNDGDLDLFVADYGSPVPLVTAYYFGHDENTTPPRLYRNDGGRFVDVAAAMGLARPMLPMGANFGDLDNDGYPDLYLGTGEPGFDTIVPNLAFLNTRDAVTGGRAFVDITFASGLGHLQKGHGVAFGDVDNDGDQDILHQLGGFFPGDAFANALFENPTHTAESADTTSWITLLLEGRRANAFGVGARIEVRVREADRVRSIHILAGSGGSFGGSSLRQEIGLGAAEAIEAIVVRWPGSGTLDTLTEPVKDRAYRLVEGSGALVPVELPRLRLGAKTQH
jgi:hypothetical protein